MLFSTNRSKFQLFIVLILVSSLALAGCGQSLQSQPGSGGADHGEEGALDEIDLSGASDDAGEDTGGEDEGDSLDGDASGDDVEPFAPACPTKMTEFVLFLTHSWDFSPNRDLEQMRVSGQTGPSSPCPLSVANSTVIMEECHVAITNTGFIQTDAGPCDISSSGEALISIEDASCQDGVISLTIVETINPDVGSGAMNCPETSQPYFPFFPFSRTTVSFPIKVGGSEAFESVDPDLSGQFMYNKTWSLHAEGLGSPINEE